MHIPLRNVDMIQGKPWRQILRFSLPPDSGQHPAANDHFQGMTDQMTNLANLGLLAGFVGMLTDSRSFLSYTRHDYFRRILCRLLGQWVEDGMFPADWDVLREMVQGICYNNAVSYFGFDLEKV